MDKERRKKILDAALVPVLAIISGLVVASFLVLLTDAPPLEAYKTLFAAGFGCKSFDSCALVATLERATPLILTGLSALVAFRSGIFSLGQEGQMMLGAIMAAWLGYQIQLPGIIHPIVIILAAMAIGGAYGYIPGVLKVKLGVNEIISTIMLNEIAILILEWVVNFPLRADQAATAHSFTIHKSAWLMTFLPKSKWGIGFVLAILAACIVYIYLTRTSAGYEQRMAGQAPRFAKFGGILNEKVAIRSMILSGALAGMAGAIEVLGVHHRIMTGFSTNLGFDGLSVAILGQSSPIGVVIVAILFAGIRIGAQLGLQIRLGIPRELGGSIISLIILFVAADQLFLDGMGGVGKLRDKIMAKFKKPIGGDS
ncbi:MAG: ABC transporter permease [Anaerolineaceae bacterium]|nr:ABC transporter permease [Anaerolineaceae bacterium]